MKIVLSAYTPNLNKDTSTISDQICVTIDSICRTGNKWGDFVLFTNNKLIINHIRKFSSIYNIDIEIIYIDYEKELDKLGLAELDSIKNTSNYVYIASKLLIPFLIDDDFLFVDYDILFIGKIDKENIKSDKIRFFRESSAKKTIVDLSISRGFIPKVDRNWKGYWLNSGMVYFPGRLGERLIRKYWYKYLDIIKKGRKEYKGIILFDSCSDELIYNLMNIDQEPLIELENRFNVSCDLYSNSYNNPFDKKYIKSISNFESLIPKIISIHFVGTYIKPYNVYIDDEDNLCFNIKIRKCSTRRVGYIFSSNNKFKHYKALMFCIVWQYYRYSIREKLGLSFKISKRYFNFFEKEFLD